MEKTSKASKHKVKTGGKREFNPALMLKAVWKKLWLVILIGVIAGAVTFVGVKFLVTPTYRSYFTAYINNKKDVDLSSITGSDVKASQALVRTYSEIMTSRYVLKEAAASINLDSNYATVKKLVSTSVNNETGIITVNVDTDSPQKSFDLAKAIEETTLIHTANIVDGSSMKIIDHPFLPTSIYKPNYIRLSLLGAVAGMILIILIICIRQFFNDKVTNEEELEDRYSIPIVGVIPDMINTDKHNKGGYYYYRTEEQ